MPFTTLTQAGTSGGGFWKAEWTWRLLNWLLGGLIAGGSASVGFYSTWQQLRADVAEVKERQDVLGSQLQHLYERQAADDTLHAMEGERLRQMDKKLDEVREDLKYLQRDLTGRVRRR